MKVNMTPEFALKHGADFPFDAPEGWGEPDWEKRDPLPPKDWAHAAARGVLADITDRRGVRQALDDVDHEIRAEIVESVAAIIRAAHAASQ
jgi:hypothetical protein